jgi:hypothetical protein
MRVFVSNVLFLLFSIVCLWACRNHTNPMEELQGVWIEAGFSFEKASDALIIKDSTVTYYPWGPQRYRSQLMVEDDRVISFGPHWETQSIFARRGDTLIQLMLYDSTIRKFILAEKDIDTTKLLYCDLLLHVTIPVWSTTAQNAIDLRDSVRFSADLSIGRLKKGEFARRPLVLADSVCIQVYDVLISDDDLSCHIRDQLGNLQELIVAI